MKKLIAILSTIVTLTGVAEAANFQVFREGDKIGINCLMDRGDQLNLDHAIGLQYGDQPPVGVFLKDAVPGTQVLLDGQEISSAIPKLTTNGYQSMFIPQDEYVLTLRRPDGAELSFPFLRIQGRPCILNWNEVAHALGR